MRQGQGKREWVYLTEARRCWTSVDTYGDAIS
jgi:hypothetical protein